MSTESNNATIKQYNCPSCGAVLKISSIENGYVQCRFCGAQVALQGEFFSNVKNEEWKEKGFKSGLPVTINRKDCHTSLVKAITRDPYFPIDVLTKTIVQKEECIGVLCYLINYEVVLHKDPGKGIFGLFSSRKDDTVRGRYLVCGTSTFDTFINAMYPDLDKIKFKPKEQLEYPRGFRIVDNDISQADAPRYFPKDDITAAILKKHRGFTIDSFTISEVAFPVCLTYFDVIMDYFGQRQHFYIRSDGQQVICDWAPHDENLQHRIESLKKELKKTPKTLQREESYYEEVPVEVVRQVTETTKPKASKAVDAALLITGFAIGGVAAPFVAGGIIANHNRAKTEETRYVTETEIQTVMKKRTISEDNPDYAELKKQLADLTNFIKELKNQYLCGEKYLNGIYNHGDRPFSNIGDDGYRYRLILEKVGSNEDKVLNILTNTFSMSFRQAVKIIDSLPQTLNGDFSKADSDKVVNALRDAGATVSIVQNK